MQPLINEKGNKLTKNEKNSKITKFSKTFVAFDNTYLENHESHQLQREIIK